MSIPSKYLTVKDHSVSGESFELLLNDELQLLETQPRPSEDVLGSYYKSEDYISHTDSKRNVLEYLYHIVRSIALKRKIRLVNSFGHNKKSLLDIGCGTGDFLHVAQNNGWEISGIEPNEQAREIGRTKVGENIFSVEHLDQFRSGSFKVITLWHVLEHLLELDKQIKIFKQLLSEDGRLIIAAPNFKSYDAKFYKKYWAAYDVPRHLWHFSQESISKLFSKINMEVEQTLPMKFDAYYVSMLSEKYKDSSLGFLKGMFRGWVSNIRAANTGEYSSLIYVLKKRNSPID